jgi:hypothetical protein
LLVFNAGKDSVPRCIVASQFVSNDHTRHIPHAFQKLAKELLGGFLISFALDQDVQNISILINRAPQVMNASVDFKR